MFNVNQNIENIMNDTNKTIDDKLAMLNEVYLGAKMLQNNGHYADALKYHEKIMQYEKDFGAKLLESGKKFLFPNILFNIGCCQERLGNESEAMDTWREVIKSNDGSKEIIGESYYCLGTLEARGHDYDNAIIHLQDARKLLGSRADIDQNIRYVEDHIRILKENNAGSPNQTLDQARYILWKIYGQAPCG